MIMWLQVNNLNIQNKNKQPKNKTKDNKKNQIENLLVAYHVLSKEPQSSESNSKENNLNLNYHRHQLTLDQSTIHQLFINMSSIIKVASIIHPKQREFLYLSKMEGKKINK